MNIRTMSMRRVGYAGLAVLAVVAVSLQASAASAVDGLRVSAESTAPHLEMKLLPVPAGVVYSVVGGGDHSGRFLVGTGERFDGAQWTYTPLRWIDGNVSELDTSGLAPYVQVDATDINSHGDVVGYRTRDFSSFLTEAFVYRNGSFTLLPGLKSTDATVAVAINAQGDVVGRSEDTTTSPVAWHAVIWPAARPGTVRELTVDGQSAPWATAVDIDDDGTVLGQLGQRPTPEQRPYIWPADGPGYSLNAPAGTGYPEGTAIHDGWVAGTAITEGDVGHSVPVRWNLHLGQATVISTEPGTGVAVNRRGTVAIVDALIYRSGRRQYLGGSVTVLADDGTAAGADVYFLPGNAVIWS
jgi:probable HAF family extracellular repeat protein